MIAPSYHESETGMTGPGGEDARLYGRLVHRALQCLTTTPAPGDEQLLAQLAREYALTSDHPTLSACLQEARTVLAATELADLFQPAAGTQAHNEVPVLYESGEDRVYGVIDRLLVSDDGIIIADYKSHRVEAGHMQQLAQRFAAQLAYYREGVRQMYPDVPVRCCVLFTHTAQRIWLDPPEG